MDILILGSGKGTLKQVIRIILGLNMIASRVCGTVSRIRTQMGDTYVHHTHVMIDNSVSQCSVLNHATMDPRSILNK